MKKRIIDLKANEYYEELRGLGTPPIVRNRQPNDAYEVVVFDALFRRQLGISDISKDNREEWSKYIIAAPDEGIDIFVQTGDIDNPGFDCVQVKKKALTKSELTAEFAKMKRTVENYCKSPKYITSDTCRKTLCNSDLDNSTKDNCIYYVVHEGNIKDFESKEDDEIVLTFENIEDLLGHEGDEIEKAEFPIKGHMDHDKDNFDRSAIYTTFCCYDLAELSNKYAKTDMGCNLLFKLNFREWLGKRISNTYYKIKNTIDNCPEYFWYYNNGITIEADNFEIVEKNGCNSLIVEKFSIVNGAQTVGSLGNILEDADDKCKNSLKNAYVMARIVKTKDSKLKEEIAVNNNTQNAINSRDMVSNNVEQKKLSERLLDDEYPRIYMEIRRGAQVPAIINKRYAHRITKNETLAQLAYAGFLLQPYTAKDKKASLFNEDLGQNKYLINKTYSHMFNYDETDKSKQGTLFKKEKYEIDELLFTKQLYIDSKKARKDKVQKRVDLYKRELEAETEDKKKRDIQERIDRDSDILEVTGGCIYYFVAAYYEFHEEYGAAWSSRRYDYEKYYDDKAYRDEMVSSFGVFLLSLTTGILIESAEDAGKKANINNLIRSSRCESEFFEKLRKKIGNDTDLETKYEKLMNKYKVIDVG